MKRASAFILALLLSLAWSVTVFAEDIFIVEDGEDEFIVNTPTTTKPAETTTASSSSGLEDLIDGDTLSGYFDSFKDKFGDGFDSFMNDLGSWEGFGKNQNTAETTTSIPKVDGGSYVPVTQSAALTTYPSSEPASAERSSDDDDAENDKSDEEELPSVLIVNGTDDDDSWGISGSALTLIVFIAAIVILILVVVVVLVIMTRKTEFDSSVKNKSTIPGVDKSDSLARFIEGDDEDNSDDGNNYSNITYWEDE
jgi:uncharacterized membrane protein